MTTTQDHQLVCSECHDPSYRVIGAPLPDYGLLCANCYAGLAPWGYYDEYVASGRQLDDSRKSQSR